ncbi:adenylate/guanylate cyclase domain-containing protein [Anabaena sp. FACHB-709]|uniref:Adenylate cyclase n=2 Tax=Nostocaceae TaxID=1162 RepID=A0A1Z4KRP6_ANAVA|nr:MULTISPECIES: adenylate/guanylate cyclase domain-containing protein [Nostocaceae]BAY71638.1 adenylate cyclase [Trichormus variabilis NIES-23]HBW31148.1 adenylate cyclase [Nostoc sp. UBA8866]MBD2172488.1 adenylate/guanylate cyclase domain-containing protein [Anabaena cylindrica FACHB-318]MBD2264045.1 adenylate/guanylate cyclase domain-containing protein [Anabaena sp. FACHB-709]MBD2273427.1 adenylate/guanylate cyclase domain-containing protein [Nostoc sp. PCC 7120 = FACHB-418]
MEKQPSSSNSTRHLTVFYTVSLSLLACLSITGQVIIQGMLSQQEKNLEVVSLIEKRRTICQEVVKFVAFLGLEPNRNNSQPNLQQLRQLIEDWQESGEKLAIATQDIPSFSQSQKTILGKKLGKIQPSGKGFREAAGRFLLEGGVPNNTNPLLIRRVNVSEKPTLAQLLAEERVLMQGLEEIGDWFTKETIAGVNRLKQVEYTLLAITLFVLFLEGILIFRPAVQKIQDSVTKLTTALQETQMTAKRLAVEQAQSEKLLLNILPQAIAERLKQSQPSPQTSQMMIADGFSDATVMFADIVGFTDLSGRIPPQRLVDLLNQIFSRFDLLAESYNLEKIKTIGDAYMVVGGLPNPRPDHAIAIAHMGLDILDAIAQFNLDTGEQFKIRIGINSGPVVAGVIGIKKFIYDLWGDTVNIASRMESHGTPNRIHVSAASHELLKDSFLFEDRGVTAIKGKGDMQTYWLKGKINAIVG